MARTLYLEFVFKVENLRGLENALFFACLRYATLILPICEKEATMIYFTVSLTQRQASFML